MKIEYPRFGEIIVEGTRFDHDVVIDAGEVRKRRKGPSRPRRSEFGHTPLTAAEELPWSGETLVIGTGYSGRLPIPDEIAEEAQQREVELLTMPTARAAEHLAGQHRSQVYAVLHITC